MISELALVLVVMQLFRLACLAALAAMRDERKPPIWVSAIDCATIAILALSSIGCATLRNGIDADAHIRPAKPEPTVQPAPPPPPKDDWAPPWFHRPKANKSQRSASVSQDADQASNGATHNR